MQCGSQLNPSAKFCRACGTQVTAVPVGEPTAKTAPSLPACSQCGLAINPSAKFCKGCGAQRPRQTAAAPSLPTQPAAAATHAKTRESAPKRGCGAKMFVGFALLLIAGGLWAFRDRLPTALAGLGLDFSTPRPVFDPAAAPKTVLMTQQVMPSDQPQTVDYQNRIRVTIPAGLITEAQTLTIAEFANKDVPQDQELQFKELAQYDITLGDLHKFDKKITVEVPYDPSLLDPAHSAADQILGRYWDTRRQAWNFFRVKVDADNHRIVTSLDHLTLLGWVLITGIVERSHKIYENVTFDFYHTPGFVILYEKARIDGSGRVSDQAWRQKGGGALSGVTSVNYGWQRNEVVAGYRADVPVYIQDLGTLLEQKYATYQQYGYDIQAQPIVVKVNSYIISQAAAFGGYEQVFNRIHINTENLITPTQMLVATGHELFHAVQHTSLTATNMFRTTGARYFWWIEASADYAGNRVANDPPLNLMGGQGSTDGVNPKLLEKPLPAFGDAAPYEDLEYDKSHFIDYLVRQRSIVFRQLHDAVMSYTGDGDPVLAPLDAYLKSSLGKGMDDVYRDFASWFLLSASSPLGTGNPETSSAEAADDYPLPAASGPSSPPLDHAFKLAAPYAARLWVVRPASVGQNKQRMIAVTSLAQPTGTWVEVYQAKRGSRFAGVPPLKAERFFVQAGKSAKLTMAADDVIYIVASNTGMSDADVKVRVSDATGVKLVIDPSSLAAAVSGAPHAFSATADVVDNATRVECEWNFGEGENPVSFSAAVQAGGRYQGNVTHRYMKAGDYTMTVRLYERAPRARELLAEAIVPITITEEKKAKPTEPRSEVASTRSGGRGNSRRWVSDEPDMQGFTMEYMRGEWRYGTGDGTYERVVWILMEETDTYVEFSNYPHRIRLFSDHQEAAQGPLPFTFDGKGHWEKKKE